MDEGVSLSGDNDAIDWDALRAVSRNRDSIDEHVLFRALGKALKHRGYHRIVEPHGGSDDSGTATVNSVSAIVVLWGVPATIAQREGWPWWGWLLAFFAFAVSFGLIASRSQRLGAVLGFVVTLAWLVLFVDQLSRGIGPALVPFLIPLALAAGLLVVRGSLRVRDAQDAALAFAGAARSAPLVAPVVLLVLFLPALSADVWKVASELSVRRAIEVAALTVGLLFFVVRQQLIRELPLVLDRRAQRLCEEPKRGDLTRVQTTASLDSDDDDKAWVENVRESTMDGCWPLEGEEYAPFLAEMEGGSFRRPLTARLAVTAVVVGALVSGYLYLLCSAVVPSDLASEWTGTTIPQTTLHFVGQQLTLSGGPYLRLSGLLGLAALAAFLSFAVVEERFSAALSGALLHVPADRFLVLALPFVSMAEKQITDQLAGDDSSSEPAGNGSERRGSQASI